MKCPKCDNTELRKLDVSNVMDFSELWEEGESYTVVEEHTEYQCRECEYAWFDPDPEITTTRSDTVH